MDNKEPPEVIIDTLEPGQMEVLQVLAKKNGSEVIRIRPLERFGFSDARLFEAFFTENRTGLPFVVKIDTETEMQKEVAAFLSVKLYFADCLTLQSLPPADTCGWGAVAYRQFTSGKVNGRNRITELKDRLDDSSISGPDIAKLVRKVYDNSCGTAHSAAQEKRVVLHEEYRKHFREHLALPRIEQALGKQSSECMCKILGTEIANPLLVLREGFRERLAVAVGPVHGDLHSSNVILDRNEEPHLIDFKWAKQEGHILMDYVLMENSMRFMLFPEHVSLDDQLKVDTALLQEKGYRDIETMQFSTLSAGDLFRRLAVSIGAVRVEAKKHTRRDFTEYLAAQFLVLYGLLRFDDYNFFSALRALGLIGKKLIKTEHVPSL